MKQLTDALDALQIPYCETMIKQMQGYMQGVLSWNEKVNLTAITDPEEFILKHLIDSVLSVPYEEYRRSRRIIDVGTGAGFPGVPLAILSPEKQFVLIDSLNKRLRIIDELTALNGISNVQTIHARAEELAKNKVHREKYDLCISRAVANLTTLSEYCLPFIRIGGYLLAYKGPESEVEVEDAERAITVLGGQMEKVEKAPLAEFGLDHRILFIKKVKNTPARYPRKPGMPSKEPLK